MWALRSGVRSTAPTLLVLVLAAALWLLAGVAPSEIGLFAVYEAVFVLGPGWVVYGALRPRSSCMERFAFGWALGYAIEIGAFAITAMLDVRSFFVAYPVLVAAFAIWRRSRPRACGRQQAVGNERWNWAVAGVAVVALVIVAVSLFPTHPLPGDVPRLTYFLDSVFQISLAAEALHHWPITDPAISGDPLPYHTFLHMHLAAVAQTTGLPLPVLGLRLVPLTLVALFALEMAFAGARVGGRPWIGPLAALLVLLSGELDLDPRGGPIDIPFSGAFSVGLWYSPTFVLGLVFYLPIVILLIELVAQVDGPGGWRDWTLLGVFFAGAAGAKAAVPPVVIAGLGLFLLLRRRPDRAGTGAFLILSAVFLAFLATMYRGGNAGMRFRFPASGGSGFAVVWNELGGLPHPVAVAVAVTVGLLGLFAAPLSGLIWFARDGSRRLKPTHLLLLCFFAAGLGPYLFIVEPGASQLFFTHYGYVAALLVSSAGIYWIWRNSGGGSPRTRFLVVAFALAWPPALLLLSGIPPLLTSSDETLHLVWYGFIAAVVLTFSVIVVGSRSAERGPWRRMLLISIVGASTVNVPLDVGPHLVQGWRSGTLYIHSGTGLTVGLYRGLEWIRDNTHPDHVIAVSNYSVDPSDPGYENIYYSAFAERRTFLEGWFYGMKTLRRGPNHRVSRNNTPYANRLRLNDAVFERGSRAALGTLVGVYGVRYLVVDRVHGGSTSKVSRLGRLVFSNADVAIYAVSNGASSS